MEARHPRPPNRGKAPTDLSPFETRAGYGPKFSPEFPREMHPVDLAQLDLFWCRGSFPVQDENSLSEQSAINIVSPRWIHTALAIFHRGLG